jgi:hypothetical protein
LDRHEDNKSSITLYEKSADMLDALLSRVPTPSVERHLLVDLSKVYSGYFEFLSDSWQDSGRIPVIERARGRVWSLLVHVMATTGAGKTGQDRRGPAATRIADEQ